MSKLVVQDKNVDSAINKAIEQLKVKSKDELIITILENGSKGFLGFGSKDAKIEAEVKFQPEKLAIQFLDKTLNAIDIEATYKTSFKDKNLEIIIVSTKDNVLIGKRGKTLESLEFLTSLVVNKGDNQYVNISIDVANYKQKRKETLEELSRNLAKKVTKTKRRKALEPMSRYERKIIHTVLQGDKNVKTYSEGDEPNRYIVIDVK